MYLLAADADNGSMHMLPFSGGLLEQPYRTMQVFEAVQAKFWERLGEQNESVKNMRPNHG